MQLHADDDRVSRFIKAAVSQGSGKPASGKGFPHKTPASSAQKIKKVLTEQPLWLS